MPSKSRPQSRVSNYLIQLRLFNIYFLFTHKMGEEEFWKIMPVMICANQCHIFVKYGERAPKKSNCKSGRLTKLITCAHCGNKVMPSQNPNQCIMAHMLTATGWYDLTHNSLLYVHACNSFLGIIVMLT